MCTLFAKLLQTFYHARTNMTDFLQLPQCNVVTRNFCNVWKIRLFTTLSFPWSSWGVLVSSLPSFFLFGALKIQQGESFIFNVVVVFVHLFISLGLMCWFWCGFGSFAGLCPFGSVDRVTFVNEWIFIIWLRHANWINFERLHPKFGSIWFWNIVTFVHNLKN